MNSSDESEKTSDLGQRDSLRSNYKALDQIPDDETVLGFQPLVSGRQGRMSFVANKLVSDVQDAGLCKELEMVGLERRDAEHITQAVCNSCDVFLTRDENTIIRPYRGWIERRSPGLKVRLPSELVEELKGTTSP